MGDLVFNGIKVEELDLTNKIEGAVSLDISQRASFNVKYTRDDKKCAATLTIDMMDKNQPMDFNFKISAVAFFDCDQLSDKKELSPQMNCTPKVRHKTFGVQFTFF